MFHAEHSKYVRNRTNVQIVKQCSHLVHEGTDVPGMYMVCTMPVGSTGICFHYLLHIDWQE